MLHLLPSAARGSEVKNPISITIFGVETQQQKQQQPGLNGGVGGQQDGPPHGEKAVEMHVCESWTLPASCAAKGKAAAMIKVGPSTLGCQGSCCTSRIVPLYG